LTSTVGADEGGARHCRDAYHFIRAESAVLGVTSSREESLDQAIRQFERQVESELSRETSHLARIGEPPIADAARKEMMALSRSVAPLFAESSDVDFEIQGLDDGGAVFIADSFRRGRRLVLEVSPDRSLTIKRVDNNSVQPEPSSAGASLEVPIRWLCGS
jgi:ribosomal protein S21